MAAALTDDELQDVPPMLSNPDLDELYAIRRILLSMYRAHARMMNLDPWKLTYYALKIKALDKAIAAYIDVAQVPASHQEQQAETGESLFLDMSKAIKVRVPGAA